MDYELWFHKEHIMPDHVGKDGSVSPMAFDEWRPATPEEIKDAHGKCGTCEHHWYGEHTAYRHLCSQDRLRGIIPTKSYCNHHELKEE